MNFSTTDENSNSTYSEMHSTSFSSDRADDKEYNKTVEKQESKTSDTINTFMLEKGEVFDNKLRKDTLVKEALESKAFRFALNSNAISYLNKNSSYSSDNIKRVFRNLGIRQSLLADTTEDGFYRTFSTDTDISNTSIMLDNYDYFLNHNTEISIS